VFAKYRYISRKERREQRAEAVDYNQTALTYSCLSGNGAKDVAEVLLTLKDKKWADRLDWHVAPSTSV